MFIYYFILLGFFVAFLLVTPWLRKQNWFLELTDESFKLFLKAYYVYTKEVIKNHKLYNLFVFDFCNDNSMLITSTDANINGAVNELNRKNRIYNRVHNLLKTRPDLVQKYFQNNNFTYNDYKQLTEEYDTTYLMQEQSVSTIAIKQEGNDRQCSQDYISNKKSYFLRYGFLEKFDFNSVKNEEDRINLIKEIILECHLPKRNKQFGDRIFGYLIKSKLIPTISNKDQTNAWHVFFEGKIKPSNTKLLKNPEDYSRSQHMLQSKTLYHQLKCIQIIYTEIGLGYVADIVGKDLERMKF